MCAVPWATQVPTPFRALLRFPLIKSAPLLSPGLVKTVVLSPGDIGSLVSKSVDNPSMSTTLNSVTPLPVHQFGSVGSNADSVAPSVAVSPPAPLGYTRDKKEPSQVNTTSSMTSGGQHFDMDNDDHWKEFQDSNLKQLRMIQARSVICDDLHSKKCLCSKCRHWRKMGRDGPSSFWCLNGCEYCTGADQSVCEALEEHFAGLAGFIKTVLADGRALGSTTVAQHDADDLHLVEDEKNIAGSSQLTVAARRRRRKKALLARLANHAVP